MIPLVVFLPLGGGSFLGLWCTCQETILAEHTLLATFAIANLAWCQMIQLLQATVTCTEMQCRQFVHTLLMRQETPFAEHLVPAFLPLLIWLGVI